MSRFVAVPSEPPDGVRRPFSLRCSTAGSPVLEPERDQTILVVPLGVRQRTQAQGGRIRERARRLRGEAEALSEMNSVQGHLSQDTASVVISWGLFSLRGSSLLPGFLRLRAELLAAALPAAGGAHRVPSVALHADHLVQEAPFGLRKAGHRDGEARAVYNGFGRRGRCFTETDLITTRFGRLGSKGGLARFNAWTIRAWMAGMSSVSGPYRTM